MTIEGGFAMSISLAARQIAKVTIVDISGNIVFGEDRVLLRNLISDLLSKGDQQIVFNLSDVDHIDSSGLSYLVSAFTSVRREGGGLKLLNPTKKVQDVMRFTKLNLVFDILDDEAAAIKSFGQSAAARA
jgi:anti-sigma B factor antagonist